MRRIMGRMDKPIVFISHLRVKEGQLEGFRAVQRSGVPQLETDKPSTLVFLAYLNETGGEVSIVHMFVDAAAMDAHFQGAQERTSQAYQYVLPVSWEVYGRPSHGALEWLRGAAQAAGVELTIRPAFEVGFLRLCP
jgi:quinol monooxygenase YgiN